MNPRQDTEAAAMAGVRLPRARRYQSYPSDKMATTLAVELGPQVGDFLEKHARA